MEFFEKLSKLLGDDSMPDGDGSLILVIAKKDNKLFLSITPKLSKDSKKKIVPLTVSGTPQELNKDFFSAISEPIQSTKGLVTNIKGYEDSIKVLEETKKKEADEKKAKAEEKKTASAGSAVSGAKKKAKKQTPQVMAEGLLKEGDKLFKSKKYKEALEIFESAKTHWAKINLGNRVMDCKVKIKAESELSEETPKTKAEIEKEQRARPKDEPAPVEEEDPEPEPENEWEEPELNEETAEEDKEAGYSNVSDDDDWN